MPMLRYLLRTPNRSVEYELHPGLNTLGRNPTNEIRISDASVSSFHAEITVNETTHEVQVRDLQSTNGTFIEGQPIEDAALQPGQALQLGCVELRLDAEQYEIRIPTGAVSQVAVAAGTIQETEEGVLACSRNPALPATHHAISGCQAVVHCPGVFNKASLRSMKLAGGTAGQMLFCPDCNAKCEPIPGVSETASKKTGLFARLTQTIQLGWKKR